MTTATAPSFNPLAVGAIFATGDLPADARRKVRVSIPSLSGPSRRLEHANYADARRKQFQTPRCPGHLCDNKTEVRSYGKDQVSIPSLSGQSRRPRFL